MSAEAPKPILATFSVTLDGRGSVAYFHVCWDVLFGRAVVIRHWIHRPGLADAPGKSELDFFSIVSDWPNPKGVDGRI